MYLRRLGDWGSWGNWGTYSSDDFDAAPAAPAQLEKRVSAMASIHRICVFPRSTMGELGLPGLTLAPRESEAPFPRWTAYAPLLAGSKRLRTNWRRGRSGRLVLLAVAVNVAVDVRGQE